MIKKYFFTEEEDYDILYVGRKADIKALYKSMARHAMVTDIIPMDRDVFYSKFKSMYGLMVTSDGYFQIVNSDTILAFLFDGLIVEA